MAGAVAGLVLMQLALPKLRTSSALRTFSQTMASCKHDLDLWRARCVLPCPEHSEQAATVAKV